ncbi:hypothetical protein [Hungatella hathewayi]|nr:hypothetical protein [Hungatella hathewayi]
MIFRKVYLWGVSIRIFIGNSGKYFTKFAVSVSPVNPVKRLIKKGL